MDISSLDLNLLHVLDAMFVEQRTTRVAKRLGMSQPMVSYALAKLRHAFSDELFVRVGNLMLPTPLAVNLRDPVSRVLDTIAGEILRTAVFNPASCSDSFTFCLSDIGELVFLPALLETFREEAPQATIRCVSLSPHELEARLADGTVDLALGYFPDLDGHAIYQQRLFDHSFAVLLRKDHPTIGASINLDCFLAAEHAVVLQEGRSQELFERRMQELGLRRKVIIQSPHFMTIPQIVAYTDIITTVPLAVAKAYAKLAPLRWVAPPLMLPPIEIKQFWHLRTRSDKKAIWLRSLIARRFLGSDSTEGSDNPIFTVQQDESAD